MYICLVAGYRISYRIIKIVIRYPHQCIWYQVLFLLCWSHLWRNGNKEYPLLERFQLGNSMTSVQRHQDFEKSHGPTDPQRHLGTSMAVLIGLGWCRWRHFGCLRWWNFMARIMQQMASDLSQPILGYLAEHVAGHPRFRWARRWKQQAPEPPLRGHAYLLGVPGLRVESTEQMHLELKLQLRFTVALFSCYTNVSSYEFTYFWKTQLDRGCGPYWRHIGQNGERIWWRTVRSMVFFFPCRFWCLYGGRGKDPPASRLQMPQESF